MSHDLRMRMGAIDGQQEPDDDDFGAGERPRSGREQGVDDEIPRGETGLRIGLTLLFVIVASVLRTLLGAIVLFELIATLITRRPPSPRVRELANRIVSYYYELGRYMTYNESRVPFPFDDFPPALEPDRFDAHDRESKALGVPLRERASDGDGEVDDEPPGVAR